MAEPFIAAPLAEDWITRLLKLGAKIWTRRKQELDRIFLEFGDCEALARTYVEPDCQTGNPADLDEDEPVPTWATWAHRVPLRRWINDFLSKEVKKRDGRNTLFVLSDAGMGKSSLLMMLKLSHLLQFWPSGLEFHLLKLGPETLDQVRKLKHRRKTVLLLDALDEDPTAWGQIEERIEELLEETRNFRQVVLTCRTQFFPEGGKDPLGQPGKVELAGFVCNLLYLSPFSDEQVDRYLLKVYPDKLIGRMRRWLTGKDSETIDRARRVVMPMRSLKMRPMLLSYIEDLMAADIGDWNEYAIYEALVESWLLREERKPGVQLSKGQMWDVCEALAVELQLSGERSLSAGNLGTLLEAHPISADLSGLEFGGRSLLNRNAEGNYRFAHYSIQEFLVAHRLCAGKGSPLTSLRFTDQILRFMASWLGAPADRLEAAPWNPLGVEGLEGAVHALLVTSLPGLEDSDLRAFEDRGQWQKRAELYERVPAELSDPERTMWVLDQLGRGTRDGNDLYFIDAAVRRAAERWPAQVRPYAELDSRFYDHIAAPPEELFQYVETRHDGRVALLREIPAGRFRIGSPETEEGRYTAEGPQHEIRILASFRLAAIPVTNAQLAAFEPDHTPYRWEGVAEENLAHHPAVNVTWYQAMAFCRWLASCFEWARGARLPTEEEWEYACRAGTESRYWSGDSEADLARAGWYGANSGGRTHRVGGKEPNPWGLYDVHGNVWEWTSSAWTGDYSGRESGRTVDPTAGAADLAEPPGGRRVIRGGCCWVEARFARSAFRDHRDPGDSIRNRGFRVLLPSARGPAAPSSDL